MLIGHSGHSIDSEKLGIESDQIESGLEGARSKRPGWIILVPVIALVIWLVLWFATLLTRFAV